MSQGRRRGNHGFTLVEVLVAVGIEAVIMIALGTAFIGILQGHKSVKASLARTDDARIAANYIITDAHNSSGPEISLSDTTSCPDPNPPVSGTATPVVRFDWDGTDSAGLATPHIVNYVLVGTSLLRRECQGAALLGDSAVASTIASATAACSPTADCTGSPRSITVTMTETADTQGSVFQYALTGGFRKLNGAGAPVTPNGVVLLGGGTCSGGAATGIQVAGGADLRIYGNAKINTPDAAGSPPCKSISLGTDANNYQAGGTQILNGGSCVASGSSSCPVYTSYSPPIADPYAGLNPPSTAGLPSQAGCPGGVAQPGLYALKLTISADCSFASGVYVFQNGLAITNSPTITSAVGGVFFYISGGTFSESGGAAVNLTATNSGNYAGLLLWHDGTTPITISNGGQLTFNGVLYAPHAKVSFTGGSVTTTVTSIVAQSISLSGGATVSLGTPSATPLSIGSPGSLPPTTVNRLYGVALTGAGGDGKYTWSASPNLPAGLSLNPNSGLISGAPTVAGSFSVTFTLRDELGDDAAAKTYTLTVNAIPSISTGVLPTGELTVAYNSSPVGSAGTTPYTWTATGLPAGLNMSSAGLISGTPTATGTASTVVTLTDAAGATVSKGLALTVNPLPTIVGVAFANGGTTPGMIDNGDTVTITYSGLMLDSGFCSSWSGTGSQSLTANNDVTVSVSDGTGATNDKLTVTSAACPSFSLGSIDLGSNAYVSSPATFTGTKGNKSQIAWNSGTFKLTITLGANAGGAVNTVATSAPVYTASAAIKDAQGASLGNSPFPIPGGQKF